MLGRVGRVRREVSGGSRWRVCAGPPRLPSCPPLQRSGLLRLVGRRLLSDGPRQRVVTKGASRTPPLLDLEHHARELGLKMSPEELRQALAAMDRNGDGKIAVTEYRAWLAEHTGTRHPGTSQPLTPHASAFLAAHMLACRTAAVHTKSLEAAALRAFIESTSKVGAMRTLRALDYFGTGVFAVAGTVVAADHG